MNTFLSTYALQAPLKVMEKACETNLCPKTRGGINKKCCELKSQCGGSICEVPRELKKKKKQKELQEFGGGVNYVGW